jgi:16S rRNA U516 pseudouridylate synthase RsuA-like enzyme
MVKMIKFDRDNFYGGLMAEERLQKYIARCGTASRRKAEELILQGRVKVNGKVVKELGSKIIPGKDMVTVDDKRIYEKEKHIYIKLHKPEGYVTTVSSMRRMTGVLYFSAKLNALTVYSKVS